MQAIGALADVEAAQRQLEQDATLLGELVPRRVIGRLGGEGGRLNSGRVRRGEDEVGTGSRVAIGSLAT